MATYNYYWPEIGYLTFDDDAMTVTLERGFEVHMRITLIDRIRLLLGCK